jgi:hypothetical protein
LSGNARSEPIGDFLLAITEQPVPAGCGAVFRLAVPQQEQEQRDSTETASGNRKQPGRIATDRRPDEKAGHGAANNDKARGQKGHCPAGPPMVVPPQHDGSPGADESGTRRNEADSPAHRINTQVERVASRTMGDSIARPDRNGPMFDHQRMAREFE